jgi:hypothetical protein
MSPRRIIATLSVSALFALVPAATASADDHSGDTGGRSLTALLAQDGSRFDSNQWDYDILDKAVRTVLSAKPGSAVGVLADGDTALTAFAPNDRAFRLLATDVTGTSHRSERAVFDDLASGLGVDTIEAVLLYHVVPGATISYRDARRADGASLETALDGASISVAVRDGRVRLVDADPDDANAVVVARDLNKGNQQIAHGVSRVLRPSAL